MTTPRKRPILTLSVARNRRAAVNGAVQRLRQQNPYANISSLIIALVMEADRSERVIPIVPESTLPLLEAMGGENYEGSAPRDVLAVSVPLAQYDTFYEALGRIRERSGQKSISALITNLLLDTALQVYQVAQRQQHERSAEPPDFSAVPVAEAALQDLTTMYYTGHITAAYDLAQALNQRLQQEASAGTRTPDFLADAFQRIALAFRDVGKLDDAFKVVSEAIQYARKVADDRMDTSLLVTALYRRAGIVLQMRQQEHSDAKQEILLGNARLDLVEAYQEGTRARRGLREEAGLRLAKVLVLSKAPPQDVSRYFSEALTLFEQDFPKKDGNEVIDRFEEREDESGIIISKAGILHSRAQLSVLYAQSNVVITRGDFSLTQARSDAQTALNLIPRTMLRWRIDIQLTLIEIGLLGRHIEDVRYDLDRLRPYVQQLQISRIEDRFDALCADLARRR